MLLGTLGNDAVGCGYGSVNQMADPTIMGETSSA
jgi:hypothetical protein